MLVLSHLIKPFSNTNFKKKVKLYFRSHPTTSALVPVLLPTLATLNNLSFYPIILCAEIYDNLKYFVTSCSSSYDQLVTSADNDQLVAVEAIRVMGNLSRGVLSCHFHTIARPNRILHNKRKKSLIIDNFLTGVDSYVILLLSSFIAVLSAHHIWNMRGI